MSQHIARHALDLFGPCRFLHAGAQTLDALTGLLLSGADAWAYGAGLPAHGRRLSALAPPPDGRLYDVAIVESERLSQSEIERILIPGALASRGLALRAPGADRRKWEARLFAAGWRRHPAALQINEYQTLDPLRFGELAFFERAPEAARPRQGEDHASDMLLTPGGRGDFLVARYALASAYIRGGDTVLDCATGSGGGAAVVAALSLARRVIGLAETPERAARAEAVHARPGLSYRVCDLSSLDCIETCSVDCALSFDLPADNAALTRHLESCRRVLRPDGRLLAGLWIEGDAQAQQTAQTHLRETLMRLFIPEKSFPLQETGAADGGAKSWQVFISSRNPTEPAQTPYTHPAFDAALAASGGRIVVDFAKGYDNPWMYRALVQIGDRLSDKSSLTWLARKVAAESRPDSADRAAALTVLGYQILEARDSQAAPELVNLLAAFFETSSESRNPHVLRWRISTAYLAGRLCEMTGDRERALAWLERASRMDWSVFSPILATKTVAASFHAGLLCLASGDVGRARDFFRHGIEDALAAARGDPGDIVGGLESPIYFGLVELSDVMDMGSQCALALANLDLWTTNPGLFWRKVDIKRFGYMTWASDMARENQKLLAENEGLRRALATMAGKISARSS